MSILKKHKYHVWVWIQDKYPLMFLIVAFVVLGISLLGVMEALGDKTEEFRSVPEIAHKILQIILFEAVDLDEKPQGWSLLGISRIVAPLLTISFSLLGIALFFTVAFKRLNLRLFKKGHTILVGIGANTREFIRSLGEGAENCVLVASNIAPEDQAFLAEYHVFIYKGNIHPTREPDWNKDMEDDGIFHNKLLCRRIAVHQAHKVIVFTDDDGFNIRAANVVAAFCKNYKEKKPGFKNPPRIICGINDLLTYQQVLESGLLIEHGIQPVNFDIICAHDALKKIMPLKKLLCTDTTFKPVHLVLLGFGSLGTALTKTFAEVGCFSDSGREVDKPIVTVIDIDADRKADAFLGLFPEIHHAIRFRKVSGYIESQSTLKVLSDIHEEANKNNLRPVVVFTVNNPTLASSYVMNIAGKCMHCNFEFFVRILDTDPNSGWLIKQGKRKSVEAKSPLRYMQAITSFGNAAALYTEEQLVGVERENNARMFHEAYEEFSEASRAKHGKQTYGVTPWEKLDPLRRYSNYCAFDHIFHKLTALDNPGSIDESQIEELAKLEHVRWNAERFTAGWKKVPPTQPKDIARKLNPCLIPWDDLPSIIRDDISYQEYDRISVKTMIRFLEKVGFDYYRKLESGNAT